jgi:hypothetical protein
MKLGINSQGLQDFILYKTWFDKKYILATVKAQAMQIQKGRWNSCED